MSLTAKRQSSDSSMVYGQRLTSAVEIQHLIELMIDEGVHVTLSNEDGAHYTTTLWAAHPDRDTISLGAQRRDPDLERLLSSHEVMAEASIDNIKLQFGVDNLVKVQGDLPALNARYPEEIIRLQRRSFFRVRPLRSAAPVARLHHPAIPDMQLCLRIVDISLGGVALALPADVPMFPAGIRMSGCHLQLDSTASIQVDLHIHHISVLQSDTGDSKLGCEIIGLKSDDESTLLAYINHTQKRQHAIRR